MIKLVDIHPPKQTTATLQNKVLGYARCRQTISMKVEMSVKELLKIVTHNQETIDNFGLSSITRKNY